MDDSPFPYDILGNYDSDKQPAKGIRSDKDDRRVLQYVPHITLLAENLVEGFSWRHTEEGYYYWNDVYSRLRRIARDGH